MTKWQTKTVNKVIYPMDLFNNNKICHKWFNDNKLCHKWFEKLYISAGSDPSYPPAIGCFPYFGSQFKSVVANPTQLAMIKIYAFISITFFVLT